MKFTSSFFLLAALGPLFALADTVAYDQTYDDASNSLNIVACSDGDQGMEVFGFSTFGSLPKFPLIGAVGAIEGYNSASCGTCWQLTYTNSKGVSKSINVLGIDHAAPGTFNIALEAMNTLTGNQAVQLGRVNVVSKQVAASVCGLNI
ncbi:cerato-platanin-related secreted protein [Roridomyces roridus]|uniref:Cerato-platanin-related secreted protein n=1 Tax=Roridomyces roridus TaxID=1738132 RepID=A0AAD7CJQ9_9AGAR|nr:cerato-platanin-related secreted protein [Roridomyces roridus]